MRARGTLIVYSVALALATIIGAFAAGLIPVGDLLVPVLVMILTAVAVISKLAAGLVVYRRGVHRWSIGIGMVPRGEVGLIFAGTGLARGVIAEGLYSGLVVVVMLTTFAAPPGTFRHAA